MSEVIRDNWKFLLAALALHAALGVVLTTSFSSTLRKIEPGQLAIQARVIDQAAIRRERERQAAEARNVEEQRQAKERAEQETRDREAEAQRQREQEVERQKKAAEEQARSIAKQKADKQKQDDAARQKREQVEKQRVADVQRKQREQAEKKKAEQESKAQAQREAELRRQMAEEESRMQARSSGLMNQYVALIQQHIMRHWNKPPSARSGIECEVKVAQVPGGAVTAAKVGKCNGDQAVRQSIEAAVMRASPLPAPPDPRLFERELLIIFKPNE